MIDARRGSTVACVLVLLLLATLGGIPVASAGSAVGSFEIDGNLADDSGAIEPIDWDTPPPNVTSFGDASGKSDEIFGKGSKELAQSSWICKKGSAPGKADILSGKVSFRIFEGKQYMYANFIRKETNGDVHMDYEFNQLTGKNSDASALCLDLPLRLPGDIVITFDTELGGKIINVRAFTWDGTGFDETPLGPKGGLWDGEVNIPPAKTIPGLKNGAFGEFALNLTDTIGDIGCGEFNSIFMKTRASTSISSELFDWTKPVALAADVPPPDLTKAKANGDAFAAQVLAAPDGLQPGQDVTLPNNVNPSGGVSSSRSGVGVNSQDDAEISVKVPASGPDAGKDLTAEALTASSTSTVTETPPRARQVSIADAVNINVVSGLVTAKKVTAFAEASATGTNSTFSSIGSAFKDLKVDGQAINNVAPNTTINLNPTLFGPGSFVKLYERSGSTTRPPAGNVPGLFTADLTVNMIRVHVTDKNPVLPGLQPVDVVVAHGTSHAELEAIVICPLGRVSGHAFIVSENTDPALVPVVVGFVDIPPNGGLAHQNLDEVTAGENGSVLTSGTSVTESQGELLTEKSNASSYAETQGACVLKLAGKCTVFAKVLRTQSNTSATDAGASSNDSGTEILGVTVVNPVDGTTVVSGVNDPAPNTTIPLDGLGSLTLNRQFCDGGTDLDPAPGHARCTGSDFSGLTVQAIHLVVLDGNNPLGTGPFAEIIVAESHSDAEF